MSLFQAIDDPIQGAPTALCGPREAFYLIAPASCSPVLNAVQPEFTFHRSLYHWLALALSASDITERGLAAFEFLHYGTHTLTWPAMHSVVAQAVAAGFHVSDPSDAAHAVQRAARAKAVAAPSYERQPTRAARVMK